MKKLTTLLICLVFSVLIWGLKSNAEEPEKTTISIGEVTASEEDTVDLPIYITNNQGLSGLKLSIQYDNNLKLKSVANGTAFSSMIMTKGGKLDANPYNIVWDCIDKVTTNGQIAVLTFEYPKVTGRYSVSVTAGIDDAVDVNLASVELEFLAGSISVSKKTECQINGHKGGTATCVSKAICEECEEEYGEKDTTNHAGGTRIENAKEATVEEDGYTGDTYCKGCNTLIQSGEIIPKLNGPVDPDATTIKVESVSGMPGNEITVPVLISKNNGIAGFSYDVEYDSDVLTLVSVTKGTILTSGELSTNGNVINWYASDNIISNGTILNLKFSINTDTEVDSTDVNIVLHNGKKNLVDEDGVFVDAVYTKGKVSIIKGILGDLNNDKDITIADVVVLNRHVIGKKILANSLLQFADINKDDDITIGDVVLLNRHILGKVNILAPKTNNIDKLGLDFLDKVNPNSTAISVGSETAKPGDTISLPVRITSNTGIAGAAFEITVSDGYTIDSITRGTVFENGTFTVSDDKKYVTWYNSDNVTADGIIMYLNITLGENAETGNVNIALKEGKANNLSDENGETVSTIFFGGVVDTDDICAKNGHTGGVATCTAQAVCEICHVAYGELNANNHAGDIQIIPAVEPTCLATGLSEGKKCLSCGVVYVQQTTVAANGHAWDAGVKKDSTCSAAGNILYTCTVCRTTKEEAIQKKDHQWKTSFTVTKNPTCTEAGYKLIQCKNCSATKDGQEIPANGHKFGAYKTTKAATAVKEGSKYRICSVCNHKETVKIAKLKATIKLSATKKTLKIGAKYTLKVSKLAKGDSVKSFTSSVKKVATVSSKGVITAKTKGKTTVTVKLKSGKTAKCVITVK